MCSCAPASTFNMSSYIGEGRYAVFTSPKSLRPQPVSPERDRARRGKVRGESQEGNPAAEWGHQTNSHLHHICQSSRLCPSNRKVGGDNLHLLTPSSVPLSMRIVGTPGLASSICIWRWRRRRASPPAPAAAAPSHMRVSQIANLSNLTTPRIVFASRDAATLGRGCTPTESRPLDAKY